MGTLKNCATKQQQTKSKPDCDMKKQQYRPGDFFTVDECAASILSYCSQTERKIIRSLCRNGRDLVNERFPMQLSSPFEKTLDSDPFRVKRMLTSDLWTQVKLFFDDRSSFTVQNIRHLPEELLEQVIRKAFIGKLEDVAWIIYRLVDGMLPIGSQRNISLLEAIFSQEPAVAAWRDDLRQDILPNRVSVVPAMGGNAWSNATVTGLQLEHTYESMCSFTNMLPLHQLRNLFLELDIDEAVVDLRECRLLEKAYIEGSGVRQLDLLNHEKLKSVEISNSILHVDNTTPPLGKNVETLEVRSLVGNTHNWIRDCDALRHVTLSFHEVLNEDFQAHVDITQLATCVNLCELKLLRVTRLDLTPLSQLAFLHDVMISNVREPLTIGKGLQACRSLKLSLLETVSLELIADMPSLQKLDVWDCEVNWDCPEFEVKWLKTLTHLTVKHRYTTNTKFIIGSSPPKCETLEQLCLKVKNVPKLQTLEINQSLKHFEWMGTWSLENSVTFAVNWSLLADLKLHVVTQLDLQAFQGCKTLRNVTLIATDKISNLCAVSMCTTLSITGSYPGRVRLTLCAFPKLTKLVLTCVECKRPEILRYSPTLQYLGLQCVNTPKSPEFDFESELPHLKELNMESVN